MSLVIRSLIFSLALACAPALAAEEPPPAPATEVANGHGGFEIDPWEAHNRRTHAFNQRVDRYVARPLAVLYTSVVPAPLRRGVGNFFTNLFQPITAVHQLLQGKPGQAGSAVGRFAINSTLGLGGLFDPATDMGLRIRREDMGQTMAAWGWRNSRFVVLPFLGPTTIRDAFGDAGDYQLGPFRHFEREKTRIFVSGLYLVDLRGQALVAEGFVSDAADDYALLRDAWLQRRRFLINDGEDELPDYLFDLEDYE